LAAIEADPNSATYYSNRAAAYISSNRFVDALDDSKIADSLDPNNAKILHRLARVYTNLGRPQDAIDVYDSIQPPATQKDRAPAQIMMQHIRQAEDGIRDTTSGSMTVYALDQASKGLGVGVDTPRKWKLLRGEAFLKMGNENALGEAQNVALSLLRQNSQDPEALLLRGRIFYAQDENDKALQHFRQALNCDPDYRDAVKYLRLVQKLVKAKEEGNDLFRRGRYQEAVEAYTQALEIDPRNRLTNAKILQNRATTYLRVSRKVMSFASSTRKS
jgi:DnaJ family protein C protein 7